MNQVKLHKKIGLEKAPNKGAFKDHLKKYFLERNFGKRFLFLRMKSDNPQSKDNTELTVEVDGIIFYSEEDIDTFLNDFYDINTDIIPGPGDLIQGEENK